VFETQPLDEGSRGFADGAVEIPVELKPRPTSAARNVRQRHLPIEMVRNVSQQREEL
jgi:hypothetical protein